eukprot:8081288-Karenia_brevis.AAC.1
MVELPLDSAINRMRVKIGIRCACKIFSGEKTAWFDKAKTREQLKPNIIPMRAQQAMRDFADTPEIADGSK